MVGVGDTVSEARTSAVDHEAASEGGLPQCGVRGCAWRGPCPEHDYSQEVDPLIAHLVRQRPLNGGRKFHRQAAHYQQTSYHRPKLTVRAVGEALAAAATALPERKTKKRATPVEDLPTGAGAAVTGSSTPEPRSALETGAFDAAGEDLPERPVPADPRPVPKPPPGRPVPAPPPARTPLAPPVTRPVEKPPVEQQDDAPEVRVSRPLRRRARRRPETAQTVVAHGAVSWLPQDGAKPAYRRVAGRRAT